MTQSLPSGIPLLRCAAGSFCRRDKARVSARNRKSNSMKEGGSRDTGDFNGWHHQLVCLCGTIKPPDIDRRRRARQQSDDAHCSRRAGAVALTVMPRFGPALTRHGFLQRKRDQVITNRLLGHAPMPTDRNHYVLFLVSRCTVDHRGGVSAGR